MKKYPLGFILSIILPIFISLLISHWFFNNTCISNETMIHHVLFTLKFFWLTSTLLVISNLAGFIIYGDTSYIDSRNKRSFKEWDKSKKLIICYVSRGNNKQALLRSLEVTKKILKKYNVIHEIEVVTDIPVKDIEERNLIVPLHYETPNKSRYKARALHYASQLRKHNDPNTWILHFDEESQLTDSAIIGIAKFISQNQEQKTIGQGEIQYNSFNYLSNWIIASVDSVRTGDDLGRFRIQYKFLKQPLFGMHGSYFLVPVLLEKSLGFDLSPKGSITEDAYFALRAYELGCKFGWIDGHIREQSPFSIIELLKQRRRWLCGLTILAFDNLLSYKVRWPLLLATILWKLAWVGSLVTMLNIVLGGSYFPLELSIFASFLYGGVGSVYLVGAYRNLRIAEIPIIKKIIFWLFTFIFLPIWTIIESIALFYSIIRPVNNFDIVRK